MRPPPDLAEEMTKLEHFVQWIPSDGQPATQKTEAFVGYDREQLYVVFVCFDESPGKIRARLSRREDIHRDEWVEIFLDTFDDQRRAYVFSVNPLGVQADAYWLEREGRSYDPSFDTVWESEGMVTDRGYVAMLAIPFKSLRFPSTREQKWGIILGRFIPRVNEGHFWPHVTSRIEGRLNQSALLTGLQNVSAGRNIQLIPYAFFRSFRALNDLGQPRFVEDRADFEAGLDAKMVVKDSFVLDVAVNPDFNQIESDEPQVTVNQRFEVFFPEKRPFFLENASYFETPNNLFFSRRVADPEFGAKFTGKRGPWAVGVLFADDESAGKSVVEDDPLFGKRRTFGVVRINRDLGAQSTVGAILTNTELAEAHNRVGGFDGRIKFSENWVTTFQAVTSSTREPDGTRSSGTAYDWSLQRVGRQLSYTLEYRDRSPGFRTEAGFLPGSTGTSRPGSPRIRRVPLRPGIRSARQLISYRFRPERDRLIAWGPDVTVNPTWNYHGKPLDLLYSLDMNWELVGRSHLGLFHTGLQERLEPGDFGALPLETRFSSSRNGLFASSSILSQLGILGEFAQGTVINIVPPADSPPTLADVTEGKLQLEWFALKGVKITGTYILARVLERASSKSIFNNHISRLKVNWQFDRRASVRAILQYNAVLANPETSSLETRKNFNTDLLFTYLVNPWTALYVGYNNNLQNRALPIDEFGRDIVRSTDLRNDSWQFFVKFSYFLSF